MFPPFDAICNQINVTKSQRCQETTSAKEKQWVVSRRHETSMGKKVEVISQYEYLAISSFELSQQESAIG